VQNIVGILMALGFGLHPLFGVLAGSVTLTGGRATGLAFAPLFEQAGVAGASSVAIAVAIGGIVMGGLVGGRSARCSSSAAASRRRGADARRRGRPLIEAQSKPRPSLGDDEDAWPIIKNLVTIPDRMWIGFWVSKGFAALGLTLPAYIGAMLSPRVIRNVDDVTGWFGLSHRFVNHFGIVSLTLFLVMALMTLKLWELAGLVCRSSQSSPCRS
jgi:ESS family glutamate:Na+ symporter